MNPIELFQSNKNLRDKWGAIIASDDYEQVILHVQAQMSYEGLSPEAQLGARRFRDLLTTIADEEPKVQSDPKPKLRHDLDNPKPNPPQPKEKKK